jgi:hypothetical protein
MRGFRRVDITGNVDRQMLDLPRVIIRAGRPDVGLAPSPDGTVRAIGAEVGGLCEDDLPRAGFVDLRAYLLPGAHCPR